MQAPYKGRSNIEFEAKLYGDISCLLNDSDQCAYLGSGSSEYADWIEEITDDWSKYPTLNDIENKYLKFLNEFIEYNPEYNYPIDPNLRPKAMFEAFKACN